LSRIQATSKSVFSCLKVTDWFLRAQIRFPRHPAEGFTEEAR
jgi:hypothetical protein